MTDQSGTTTYYYDALNRVTTESLPDTTSVCAGSSPSGLTYSYDGVGNLLTYCDSGGTTTYAYDPDNRLLSIAEPGGSCGSTPTLCTTFGYNADGNRTTITFPGGATQTTGFDNAQNVSSVVGKSSTGTTLTSFAYTYANGANDTPLVQTATENDPVASNTYTYAYDALNRLTGASVTSGTGTAYSYTYDPDNNMLTRTAGSVTTTYADNSADQLCWAYVGTSSNPCATTPTGATTYGFDANGNESGSSAGAYIQLQSEESDYLDHVWGNHALQSRILRHRPAAAHHRRVDQLPTTTRRVSASRPPQARAPTSFGTIKAPYSGSASAPHTTTF